MPQPAQVQKERRKQLPHTTGTVALFSKSKNGKYTQGDVRTDDLTLKLIQNSGHAPARDLIHSRVRIRYSYF